MAREYISMQNLKFLLYDVHSIDRMLTHPRYAHIVGREELDLLLDSAKDLADREMFPWFKEMDMKPVHHKDGRVHSHPQLKNIFKAAAEAGWFSATTRFHHEPEHRMVGVAARIVAERGADFVGHLVEMRDQVVDAHLGQVGMFGQRLVGIVHIGRMVLVVVDFHRLGIDVRLERVVSIRQIGKLEWPGRRRIGWLGRRDEGR